MIVWLASYPRSGNTLLRIVLHRLYGVPTYAVYDDDDNVAHRLGLDVMGARDKPADLAAMARADDIYFVKTHRHRAVTDGSPAICLVRDGRDAAVSWARLRTDDPLAFADDLRGQFTAGVAVGTGGWGSNVLSWLDPPSPSRILLRYEHLIAEPATAVHAAVFRVAPHLEPRPDARPPTFAELQRHDDGFFRRGVVGSHRDELPADLHDLFWAHPANAAAMRRLSYER